MVLSLRRNHSSLVSFDSYTCCGPLWWLRGLRGGGKPSSSSFMIKMDEYNKWRCDSHICQSSKGQIRYRKVKRGAVYLVCCSSDDTDGEGKDESHGACKYECPPWHLNFIIQEDAGHKRDREG